MYQLKDIKLIIWDLDETFWNGTFSEGSVYIPETNRQLIMSLADLGIVSSICSKNDYEKVKKYMQDERLWDLFVFASINWDSKGIRIKQMISEMKLRPQNVLFIDDNVLNREEAKFYCSDLLVEGPDIIPLLIEQVTNSEKKDCDHKRLNQYRSLEKRSTEKQKYTSNERFLLDSNIQVSIHYDCLGNLERIHELNIRSNQLNFTKIRSSIEELNNLLSDRSVQAGYVSVKDKYGDYGIVGFYALKNRRLVHFAFSCRILGMGVEQYIYNTLGRPELEIVGDIVSDLSDKTIPSWINQNISVDSGKKIHVNSLRKHMILVKGPCDLFQLYPYISNSEMFDTEFTYTTSSGVVVESTSHTTHIMESKYLSPSQKQRIIDEVPFADSGIFNDNVFRNDYRVVFLSILTDANLGVYQRKESGEKIAFLEYLHPITEKKNWDDLISGKYHNAGFHFTYDILQSFSEKYEFIGRNMPEQTVANLDYIRKNISSECILVILLGGELYYEKNTNPSYSDRHIFHKQLNNTIREWARDQKNVRLLDVNKYLVDQSSFYDHFNHYIKPVYYALAKEVVDIVNEATGSDIKEKSRAVMGLIRMKEILAPYYYKLRRTIKR